MIQSNMIDFHDREGNEASIMAVTYNGIVINLQWGTFKSVWGGFTGFETVKYFEVA